LSEDILKEKARRVKAEAIQQRRRVEQQTRATNVDVTVYNPPPMGQLQRQQVIDQIPPLRRGMGFCPACGTAMKKGARSTDSGSGCLILIVGIVFSPLLIGIPLILVGLHYMTKRQGFWSCPYCGMETGRKIGLFELTW
jgi:hypothetical protein